MVLFENHTGKQIMVTPNKPVQFKVDGDDNVVVKTISTPRQDMFIVRLGVGARYSRRIVDLDQQARTLLPKLAQALSKPQLNKERFFESATHQAVYAYSIDPANLEQMVREDKAGRKTVGKVANGLFCALPAD